MDAQDQEYKKGFNHAYALKENGRELFYDTIIKGLQGESAYRDGLVEGGRQFDQDRVKQRLKERMNQGKSNERGHSGR